MFDVAPFLRFVPEEILALCQFLARRLGGEDWFERIGVIARVPGLGGVSHRRGGEVLYLFEVEVEALGDDGQFGHILLMTAWMGRYEVGDNLFSEILLAVDAVELALEFIELLERRLAHEVEHAIAGVLGGHLQTA